MKVRVAKTLFEKSIGLLGSEKLTTPLLISTRFGIHTFGMKYSIDVVVLDEKHAITAMKEHIRPWRIFLWDPRYHVILELPKGYIRENKLSIGQKLSLFLS